MPSERKAPLSFMLLALLTAGPANAYRLHRFLLDTGKTNVVNIASRNSVYQSLGALERDGLVSIHSQGGRDSILYALTDAGRSALDSWLAETISVPREEYPGFPAALAVASLLTPTQLADFLERRRAHLAEQLAAPTPEQIIEAADIARIYVLEEEYQRARITAEWEWLSRTINELLSGSFTWRHDPHTEGETPTPNG
jgi:DNA-binding PadR family transcriptional regulator